MKTITVRDLQKRVRACIETARKEAVVVTRDGRPAAVVIGVAGYDGEDLVYRASPAFWKMIGARRRGKTIPWGAAKRRLEAHWNKQGNAH